MGGPKNKGYKRSWKNLLLNKNYQLRFTLFMVVLSALLMGLLGYWVRDVAHKATVTTIYNLWGAGCKDPLANVPAVPLQEQADRSVTVETSDMQFVEPAPAPTDGPKQVAPGTTDELEFVDPNAKREPIPDPHGDSAVVVVPHAAGPTPEEKELSRRSYERCVSEQKDAQNRLQARERLIGWVLLAVGGMLVLGLFGFGIKMTHRVAGPLFKVQLYFKKLRDGRFDRVYSLRKGDHLVEFYEHFKAAYEGLRKTQEEGLDEFRAMIEAAEKADLASKSPEIAAVLEEMRAALKSKEDSLG